ncbi:MAG: S-methyl-5-thioribose-1-phosphate isomerase [Bacteroidales bacterium]|nr:S-methyl-5-thioribose-1-phosphate isomerase [Bacteroidales bacterium]
MLIDGKHYTTIMTEGDNPSEVMVIDQSMLPFEFRMVSLKSVEDVFAAISSMQVRGAPLIGVTAAYGLWLATLELTSLANDAAHIANAAKYLISSRPTAVNLEWAVKKQMEWLEGVDGRENLQAAALKGAGEIRRMEIENCRLIGVNGMPLIEEISKRKEGKRVNILTHCNAGWLACVDWGTATAPIYMAHDYGIDLHVWVDETRPRNQGSRLTAWELGKHGVPHTIITDNAGGYLMQKGQVDMVITGSDRTASNGDVANKTGTYLKALAARDNKIPFWVALPLSSIDLSVSNGLDGIGIEQRDSSEVTETEGWYNGEIINVRTAPLDSPVSNYGFDITPAALVTGLITEKGLCGANNKEIVNLFKE